MKKINLIIIVLFLLLTTTISAQKIYPVTSGGMIFSSGTLEFTDAYLAQYPGAQVSKVPVRFTVFYNFYQNWHFDINGNVGFYTGLGISNVGMISDEVLYNNNPNIESYQNYKIIRRLYTGSIPLALKLGSFKDNFYIYGGGEYELAIHYKEKYWNSHDRDGAKTKYTEWFGNQTPSFIPSVFAGIQLPKGLNLKFKYYLDNFFNHEVSNTNFITDLSKYKNSQVWLISLSFQFNSAYLNPGNWDEKIN
ncbi:MAG: hypothetical protein ABFS16_00360 [Bacteroidota bacterium]